LKAKRRRGEVAAAGSSVVVRAGISNSDRVVVGLLSEVAPFFWAVFAVEKWSPAV
jgi:hypothetical protein